jgi:hypothetical protein
LHVPKTREIIAHTKISADKDVGLGETHHNTQAKTRDKEVKKEQ